MIKATQSNGHEEKKWMIRSGRSYSCTNLPSHVHWTAMVYADLHSHVAGS